MTATTTTNARKIVIPMDSSDSSQKTLQFYISTIAKPNDIVHLIHVSNFERPVIATENEEVRDHDFETALEQLEVGLDRSSDKLLTAAQNQLSKHDIQSEKVLLRGDARHEIESYLQTLKPELCLMGRRGLGRISRALMGSVSSHVSAHSTVPVLIVSE
jgi:nucleotide-binding universal stress UspA family protein